MNVLKFTIPVSANKNIILKNEIGPYFYQHLHRHDEMQLTWIERGEGTLVISNEMHAFSSGDIFCIGANQPHVFKSDPAYFSAKSKKSIKALTVFFNPNSQLKGLFSLAECLSISSLINKYSTGFIVPDDAGLDVAYKIKSLFNCEGILQLNKFLELLDFVAHITNLKVLSQHDQLGAVSENEGLKISRIYHYILMNYGKEISLEQIAEKANMTPQAFCRYFKKRTLRTFISFLNEVRINEACQKMVKENFESISLVAYNCGFNSVTHFNRVFKGIIGKSPTEYLHNYNANAYNKPQNIDS